MHKVTAPEPEFKVGTENGENVKSFSLKPEVKKDILAFLVKQPMEEVRSFVTLLETSEEYDQTQISQLVTFISKFPLYMVLAVFNALVEGIIPNIEEESESQETTK